LLKRKLANLNQKLKNSTMSLFSKKNPAKENINEVKQETKKTVAPASKAPERKIARDFSNVLISPRITEKATESAEKNRYVFEVDTKSNKNQIRVAVEEMYGVKPVKINITKIPSKNVFSKGKKGVKSGGKKAIIYLKKGDSMEII